MFVKYFYFAFFLCATSFKLQHHVQPKELYMQFFDIGETIASVNDKILMENAERLGRIERDLIGKRHGIQQLPTLPLKSAMEKSLADGTLLTKALLLRDGCVSVKNAISAESADRLLQFVNAEEESAQADVLAGEIEYDRRFGAVNNRRKRADMFLPYNSKIVKDALHEAVMNLSPLIGSLDGMSQHGSLHELSCIISDPGSPTQCVYCDTPCLPSVAPLYTFFIALQDIEDDMGHTTFLPKTHVKAAHDIFNAGIKQKEELIAISPAVRSGLKKGDTVIFDSRVLHCGGANVSAGKRRVLFYFTFTAGDTEKNNPNPSRGMGSIRDEDKLKHSFASLMKA